MTAWATALPVLGEAQAEAVLGLLLKGTILWATRVCHSRTAMRCRQDMNPALSM